MTERIHCCGIIVFYDDLTVVVKTEKGNYSYPKGKKEKGETHLETAYRELKEETNINRNDIELFPETVSIDERKGNNNNISVRYFIGKLKKQKPVSFEDPEELDEVKYMKVSDVLLLPNENMKERRKAILETAYHIYQTQLTQYKQTRLSKSLSWLLRHGIVQENMNMDDVGYVLIDDILGKEQFKDFTRNHIIQVVQNNDKQRFDIRNNTHIRARQGHSEEVGRLLDDDKMLPQVTEPLPVVIHDTNRKAIKLIKESGLKSMNRKHIHFAAIPRKTSKVLIYLDMEQAMLDGIKFYRSDNDVILCKQDIDPKYFKKIEYL